MSKIKKVCVLGHFGFGKNLLNGQTVKTKMVADEIENSYPDDVFRIDSCGGTKTLFKAPFQIISAFKYSRNVIILPAHNGLRVYVPLLMTFKKLFFKKRKVHYVVIGGWLPQFLTKRKRLAQKLKQFDGIYVETVTMKNALIEQGFENVYVMPNFKRLTILSEDELVYPSLAPYKLCTFSRVMKEKGIETAVELIKKVNDALGYTAYSLDVYGQVDSSQVEWFETLKERFPTYVKYCGCVDANKSVEVLQQYFALLFPTHFYTEGIPGTIIDAYAAGIPVISAKWESYSDVVDEGITGKGYDFDDVGQFEKILLSVAQDPSVLMRLKVNCISKAKDYVPEVALKVISDNLLD